MSYILVYTLYHIFILCIVYVYYYHTIYTNYLYTPIPSLTSTPIYTPICRSTIVKKIVENLAEISSPEGLRVGLWILGEYASAPDPGVRVVYGVGGVYDVV